MYGNIYTREVKDMLIQLDNALLDTTKKEGRTLIDVYMKDDNSHLEYRESFSIIGRTNKKEIIQSFRENEYEFN